MTKTTIYERRFAATNRCKENKWTIRQHKVEGRVIGFPLWLTQSLLKDEVSAKYW